LTRTRPDLIRIKKIKLIPDPFIFGSYRVGSIIVVREFLMINASGPASRDKIVPPCRLAASDAEYFNSGENRNRVVMHVMLSHPVTIVHWQTKHVFFVLLSFSYFFFQLFILHPQVFFNSSKRTIYKMMKVVGGAWNKA
jgi:hypothetical protein